MLDRTNYALADFLLFSARVYHRMFELHNAALWPLHVLALIVGLGLVIVVLRPSTLGVRLACALLAVVWSFVGWSFFVERYATINWAAVYVAPLFVLQALLFGCMAARPRLLGLDRQGGTSRSLVLGVLIVSLIGYPLVAALLDRPWQAAEFFAIAPDPTVTATLAFLAAGRGVSVAIAAVIPALWVIVTSLTLHTLGLSEFFLAPLAAVVCAAALMARR